MKQVIFEIIENTCLVPNVYRMRLQGDTSAISAPGLSPQRDITIRVWKQKRPPVRKRV